MTEIINRLRAQTPLFFKRLRNMALSAGISCYAAYNVCPAVDVHNPFLLAALKYSIVACAFTAGTSQLTKNN